MKKELNIKERLAYLTSLTPSRNIEDDIKGGQIIEVPADNRAYVRRDIRAELNRMKEDYHINNAEIGRLLGCTPQYIWNYLNGKSGIPYDKVEQILFLLDGKITIEVKDEHEN